jgi:molecular chaperone GrpE (heat shock protein)
MTLIQRLKIAWGILKAKSIPQQSDLEHEALIRAQNEAASARLDADETRQNIKALQRRLDAEQNARSDAIESSMAAQLEPIIADAAALLAQISLQDHIIQSGKPVQSSDVMALARQFVRIFERIGLQPSNKTGERAVFSPEIHRPLSGGSPPPPGASVIIKMPGFLYKGRLIRPAMIAKED